MKCNTTMKMNKLDLCILTWTNLETKTLSEKKLSEEYFLCDVIYINFKNTQSDVVQRSCGY